MIPDAQSGDQFIGGLNTGTVTDWLENSFVAFDDACTANVTL